MHSNMFRLSYVTWFDVKIEGKSALNREEQDWGGRLEFMFNKKYFPKEIEDYFLLMEDECSTLGHLGFLARVKSVAFDMRKSLLRPPDYDPRSIVDLVDKYGDAHVLDSGWREVDTDEWTNCALVIELHQNIKK